jgi:hypothetical protein
VGGSDGVCRTGLIAVRTDEASGRHLIPQPPARYFVVLAIRYRRVLGAMILTVMLAFLMVAGFNDYSASRRLKFEQNPHIIPHSLTRGASYEFPVNVINDSNERASLIGSADFCAKACLSTRGLPLTLQPMSKAQVYIHIDTMVPGSFSEALTFYTDRASQPKLVLNLKGIVELGSQ